MNRTGTGANRLRGSVQWLRQHWLAMVGALAGLVLAVPATAYYWTTARFMVSTDDAYVQADSTIVASRVSGYVSAVLIEDDQPVKTGQVLARIDDRDLRASLDQTRAEVQASQSEVDTLQAQLAEQSTLIAKTRASVAASQAALDLASLNRVRYRKMAGIGFGSEQQSQEADAQARERIEGIDAVQSRCRPRLPRARPARARPWAPWCSTPTKPRAARRRARP